MLEEAAQERPQLLVGSVGDEAPLVGPALHPGGAFVPHVVRQLWQVKPRVRASSQAFLQVHHAPAHGPEDGVGGARVPLERGVLREDVDVDEAEHHAEALVAGPRRPEDALSTHARQRALDGLLLAGADDGRERAAALGAGPRGHPALRFTAACGDGRQKGVDVGPQVGKAPVALSFPPMEENVPFVAAS